MTLDDVIDEVGQVLQRAAQDVKVGQRHKRYLCRQDVVWGRRYVHGKTDQGNLWGQSTWVNNEGYWISL